MLNLIKSNNTKNYVVIVVVMLIVWGFKFYFMPTPIESYENHNYFLHELSDTLLSKYLYTCIAFILCILFAFYINKVNSDLSIIDSAYQLPGIVFALLTGFFINAQRLIPEMFAGMLLFIAVVRVFSMYEEQKIQKKCFEVGFISVVSFIIHAKLIYVVPVLFITMIIIKPLHRKEIFAFILGLLLPTLLLLGIVYLYMDVEMFIDSVGKSLQENYSKVKYTNYHILIFLPIVLFSFYILISEYFIRKGRRIITRYSQNILKIIVLIEVVVMVLPYSTMESVFLLYAPLSLLLANIIVNAKKVFSMIVIWSLLLCILFGQIVQIRNYFYLFLK